MVVGFISALWCEARNNFFDRGDGSELVLFSNSQKLAELLGVDYPEPGHFLLLHHGNPEIFNTLTLLAHSPHKETIFAMLKARKEANEGQESRDSLSQTGEVNS